MPRTLVRVSVVWVCLVVVLGSPDSYGSEPESLRDAQTLRAEGRYAEALVLARAALAQSEADLGARHPKTAQVLNTLGELLMLMSNLVESEPVLTKALEIREVALGPEHPDTAESLNALGLLRVEQGRYGDAVPLHRRALAIRDKVFGPDHPAVAESLSASAELARYRGQITEAAELYKRSLEIREEKLGKGHPDVAESLGGLGLVRIEQGRFTKAADLYRRSLAIREAALGAQHPDVAKSQNNLAVTLISLGRPGEAEQLLAEARDRWIASLGPSHIAVAYVNWSFGTLRQSQKRYDEALAHFQKSVSIFERVWKDGHPLFANVLTSLARTHVSKGGYLAAELSYRRALEILESKLGPDHSRSRKMMKSLAVVLQLLGRHDDAAAMSARSKGL